MVQVWYDADGLNHFYGVDKATPAKAGETKKYDQSHEWEVKIDLTTLSTSAQTIIDDFTWLPKGYRVQEVVIIAETAATSGGSATLDFGLSRTDARSSSPTELDYDGLIAALAKTAIDAAGEQNTITVGSTGAGALIGTTLANDGVFVAKAGTAVFTAGVVKIKVRAYRP